jgi:hypothetical protein
VRLTHGDQRTVQPTKRAERRSYFEATLTSPAASSTTVH